MSKPELTHAEAQAFRDEESRRWALVRAVETLAQGSQLPASITSADIAARAQVFLQVIRPDLPVGEIAGVAAPTGRVTPLRAVAPAPA